MLPLETFGETRPASEADLEFTFTHILIFTYIQRVDLADIGHIWLVLQLVRASDMLIDIEMR